MVMNPDSPDVSVSNAPPTPTPSPTPAPAAPDASRLPAERPTTEPTMTPTIVRPQHRGGLAGIIDEFRDAVAGPAPGRVYTDKDGNKYIQHPDSPGNEWLRIVGTAIRGAAAGAAEGRGPGGAERGAAAGIAAADQARQNQQKHEQQLNQEVLENFNSIKLKHEIAASEFALNAAKTKMANEQVTFSQQQLDREKALGSADLGVYKDEADLTRVQEQNPDFWKHVYQNNVVVVPEVSPDGTRQGIHLFLRTPGVGSQLMPAGTPIKIFTPGKGPNDPPTLTEEIPTIPLTRDQVEAYDNSAIAKMNDWHKNQNEQEFKQSEIAKNKVTEKESPSVIAKNEAEANKANAEAGKARAETTSENEVNNPELVKGIGDGSIAPDTLRLMLGKKEGQQLLNNVKRAYPDLDTSKLESYPKMYVDYTSGKTSQTLRNLNSAFQTVQDLRALNTYSSRLPAGPARTAWDNKLTTASAEIANGLAKPGATATKDEIASVRKSLDTIFSRDSALDKQVESLVEQYRSIRNSWKNGAPSDVYEAKMPDLSPEGKRIVRQYFPQESAGWWGKPVVDPKTNKVIGYSKDGKTMEPVQDNVQ